ncbi:DUF4115 domain-containing protein [Altererythrobacter xixiisoli]|uniref:DUF4115 domain-containing protein n=1 Tax=Croceibacterium xixiisoli TaxID=1476466 RepID=A0A6I4TPL2_9SPHN|nr:helix-turn-helix domain-containing protein [Croceibacterium xixiisoli]MXO98055.1 DUF4115 domain-containing protein [Croceibacterium xixiisoli]
MSDHTQDNEPAGTAGIGARLKAAREAQGLSMQQLAEETRIPQRHLEAMEDDRFIALPGRTYALGFARTYAKLVELDPEQVAEEVRIQLNRNAPPEPVRSPAFEPGDPTRVPSRGLLWLVVLAVVVALGLAIAFLPSLFAPAGELPSLLADQEQTETATPAAGATPAAAATAAPTGPVVFTALEADVWVKFYDGQGTQLMQKQMAKGETYTVPADAQGPQLWTGRPDALSITVGGRAVPKLSDTQRIMRDIPITPQALLARGQATPAPVSTQSPQ